MANPHPLVSWGKEVLNLLDEVFEAAAASWHHHCDARPPLCLTVSHCEGLDVEPAASKHSGDLIQDSRLVVHLHRYMSLSKDMQGASR